MSSRWFFSSVRRKPTDFRNASRLKLEREGYAQIRRIASAIENVPWTHSLLNILWIGGPVTLIGALGGYYLGYGHMPTLGNLIFLFFFAIVTGVSGILTTIVHNYRQAGRYRRRERRIARVMSALPELILATRNLWVETLEGDARKREAATLLLRKQDLSAAGLELATRELLGNDEMARLLVSIDVYRRQGLYARINDLLEDHRETLDTQLGMLNELAPEATNLLRERLNGRVPSLSVGVPRSDNFIERILSAIEDDDELLMTVQDVEEILILAFELLNGRRIPTLVFEYKGRWRLARTLDALELARSRYRIAQATGMSRLQALTAYLAEQSDTLVEDAAAGLRSEVLLERSRNAMDALAEECMQLAEAIDAGEHDKRSKLRERADTLSNAVRLFKHTRDGYNQTARHHVQLMKLSQRWEHLSNDVTRLQLRGLGNGLRIREDEIGMDDSAKSAFCKALNQALNRYTHRVDDHSTQPLDISAAKQLAIDIAIALEPHIHLSHAEVQRAIYATHAADFSPLERHHSGAAKAALGAAMVNEVVDDLSRSAESLAMALVRHYRIELEPEAIAFLSSQYGARESTLNMVSKYDERERRPVSYLSNRPPVIGATPRHWYRALVRARQALLD